MHPIERLRYVARAGGASDRILVAESMPAFSAFASRPEALLVSLRQLIRRQPESPGLVVLGATMLTDLDPISAGWSLVELLEADRTRDHANRLATDEAGGIELIETIASGPGQLLCRPGVHTWIDDIHRRGRTVAVPTPLGSRLPRLLWRGFTERIAATRSGVALEIVDSRLVDELVGPCGVQPVDAWSPDCPDVAELVSF